MVDSQEGNGQHTSRLILYVGKGGVGKTTVAAATAVRAAELGHRTLIVSTDIAHSLADVLGTELDAQPKQVADRLFAQEVNVLEEVRSSWGTIHDHVSDLMRREGFSDIQADELAIVPGMEEVAALVQIGRRIRTGEFDCIVVDAAPTGETIRLLSMPESFQWYAGRIQEWRGRLMRFVGPLLRGALPDLNIVDVLGKLSARVKDLRSVLTDPERSSYRIVVTPDRVVLKEALRAETYLNVFDYPIDAVVLNRVLPATTGSDFLAALAKRQNKVVGEIRSAFAVLPVFEAPLLAEEPVGIPALSSFGAQIFADRDPTAVMHVGPTQKIIRSNRGYLLQIPMPNVEIAKLSLTKRGDALYVDVGNFRREVTLPLALAALEPGTARMRAGVLEIPFAEPRPGSTLPA